MQSLRSVYMSAGIFSSLYGGSVDLQNGTSPLNDPLFPDQLNVGTGTGMGTLIPICPGSTWFVKYRAAAPDEV